VIDTHSHIYLSEFDEDRDEMIQRARLAGLESILMPNVDETTIESMHQLEDAYPDYCYSMMGIHPTSIKSDYIQALKNIEPLLDQRKYIAIGEIGIDLYWDKTYKHEQMCAFEEQIIWAKKRALPVVIHCRDAFSEVFEVVEKQLDDSLFGVFHSFSGDEKQASRVVEYGTFKLGINGVVTFKNTNLRDVLKTVPLNKLILETDAPYLAPVPKRGKRNEPAYIEKVAETLSQVYNQDIKEIKLQTSASARELFAI